MQWLSKRNVKCLRKERRGVELGLTADTQNGGEWAGVSNRNFKHRDIGKRRCGNQTVIWCENSLKEII